MPVQLFGPQTLPVDPAGITGSLAETDTLRAALAGLLKAFIVGDLGGVWSKAVAKLPPSHSLREDPATPVVRYVLEQEPTDKILQQVRAGFPMLAVWRAGRAERYDLTLEYDALKQPWAVELILGPLAAEDARRLADVLHLAEKSITRAIRLRHHPGYASDALQFNGGGIVRAEVTGAQVGELAIEGSTGSTLYYGVHVDLEITEWSREDITGDAALTGADYDINLGAVHLLAQS